MFELLELQGLYTSARSAGNMSIGSTTTPETAPFLHVSTAHGTHHRPTTCPGHDHDPALTTG